LACRCSHWRSSMRLSRARNSATVVRATPYAMRLSALHRPPRSSRHAWSRCGPVCGYRLTTASPTTAMGDGVRAVPPANLAF